MEDIVYTTGGCRITIRSSDPEHRPGYSHRHHRGEDSRAHHRQPHHGPHSYYPASEEYAEGQDYPRLTAENLAAYERRGRSDRAHQAHRRQEGDTAAQCGQWYPEEHRHRRHRSDDTAHAQHNRPTHYAVHHGHGQASGRYHTGHGHAAEGRRSGDGYNPSYVHPHYHGVSYGVGYQRQHTHHPGHYQSDRPVLGEEMFGSRYSYGEEAPPRRRTGGGSQAQYVPEWMLYREGLANVKEGSAEGSIQCEIEEVE